MAASASRAATFERLYALAETQGARPESNIVVDASGNVYATAEFDGPYDGGTVFKVARDGTLSVLHAFPSYSGDGNQVLGGVLLHHSGEIYGTTQAGGSSQNCDPGCGTVYKIAPDGTESIIYSFNGIANGAQSGDGAAPSGSLVDDAAGNLYGTTQAGGFAGSDPCEYSPYGCGTVFKIAPDGTETVLYAFTNENGDGAIPRGGVAIDLSGNVYGTTDEGGAGGCHYGCGTLFKVSSAGAESILHAFQGGSDGSFPNGSLIADSQGNLYGATYEGGGSQNCGEDIGCGTTFEFTQGGTEKVLYSLTGGAAGGYPLGGVVRDNKGNFYGTTSTWGQHLYGTVFKLSQAGVLKTLHSFGKYRAMGETPDTVMLGKGGYLYGATEGGGKTCARIEGGCGTVFKLDAR